MIEQKTENLNLDKRVLEIGKKVIHYVSLPILSLGMLGITSCADYNSTTEKAVESTYNALKERDAEKFCELTGRDTVERRNFINKIFKIDPNCKSKHGNKTFAYTFGHVFPYRTVDECYFKILDEGNSEHHDKGEYDIIRPRVKIGVFSREDDKEIKRLSLPMGRNRDGSGWEMSL